MGRELPGYRIKSPPLPSPWFPSYYSLPSPCGSLPCHHDHATCWFPSSPQSFPPSPDCCPADPSSPMSFCLLAHFWLPAACIILVYLLGPVAVQKLLAPTIPLPLVPVWGSVGYKESRSRQGGRSLLYILPLSLLG